MHWLWCALGTGSIGALDSCSGASSHGLAGKQEYELGDLSRTAAVKLGDAIAAGSSKVGEAARVVAAGVGGWTQERKKLLRKVFAPSREPSTGSSISMPTQCTAGSRQSSSGYCHDP